MVVPSIQVLAGVAYTSFIIFKPKNKDLVIDFRKCHVEHKASILHGAEVHTVQRWGFGGTLLDF